MGRANLEISNKMRRKHNIKLGLSLLYFTKAWNFIFMDFLIERRSKGEKIAYRRNNDKYCLTEIYMNIKVVCVIYAHHNLFHGKFKSWKMQEIIKEHKRIGGLAHELVKA